MLKDDQDKLESATDAVANQAKDSATLKSLDEGRTGMDSLLKAQRDRLNDLKELKSSGITKYGFNNPLRENPHSLQEEAEDNTKPPDKQIASTPLLASDVDTRSDNVAPEQQYPRELIAQRLPKLDKPSPSDRPHHDQSLFQDPEVNKAREHFEELTDRRIPEKDAKFIKSDMAAFEARMACRQTGKNGDELIREVKGTYEHLSRLLAADVAPWDGPRVSDANARASLTRQIMHQAAHPEHVRQGNQNTCGVGAIESRMYAIHPSSAARLVTDAALYFNFKTAGGDEISLSPYDVRPDAEAARWTSTGSERGYASQLFQIAAVNINYQNDGSGRFYGKDPNAGNLLHAKEGVFKRYCEEEFSKPTLFLHELQKINDSIVGAEESDAYIIHPSMRIVHKDMNIGRSFESPEQLQATLLKLKSEGRLPVITSIDTKCEPFWSDGGSNWGSSHCMTVTDINSVRGSKGIEYRISLDNQWSQSQDLIGKKALKTESAYLALCDSMTALEEMNSGIGGNSPQRRLDRIRLGLYRPQTTGGFEQVGEEIVQVVEQARKSLRRDFGEDYWAMPASHDLDGKVQKILQFLSDRENGGTVAQKCAKKLRLKLGE